MTQSWASSMRTTLAASGTRCATGCGSSRCRFIRKDPPDRVRSLCGAELQEARTFQTGNLQVPGFCAHLRQVPTRRLPDQEEVTSRPHVREAPGDQGGVAASNAQANS